MCFLFLFTTIHNDHVAMWLSYKKQNRNKYVFGIWGSAQTTSNSGRRRRRMRRMMDDRCSQTNKLLGF